MLILNRWPPLIPRAQAMKGPKCRSTTGHSGPHYEVLIPCAAFARISLSAYQVRSSRADKRFSPRKVNITCLKSHIATRGQPCFLYFTLTTEMTITVGVLALQGAFIEHVNLLKQAVGQDSADWEFIEVRTPQELARCDGLVLPGGESTTMSLVAARSNLLEPLREFVK